MGKANKYVMESYDIVQNSEAQQSISPPIAAQVRIVAALRRLNKREINRTKALHLIDGALLALVGEEPDENTFHTMIDAVLTNFVKGNRSITEAERELRTKAESEDKRWTLVTRA